MTGKPITAILLDLDDTILYDDLATEQAFAATAAHAQRVAGVDPECLIAAVKREAARIWWEEGPFPEWCEQIGTSELEGLRSRFAGDDPHWAEMRVWGPGFRVRSWRAALTACGIDDAQLSDDLDTRFENERAAANLFIPGAREALAALAAHYRLAIVTNGIPDVQREKLVRTGLDRQFDVVVVSGELGVGKPDPRIYEAVLREVGAAADEALMVGDSFARDVAGAQAVGIRAVWISGGKPQPDPSVTPFLTVASLADLPRELAAVASRL